MWSVSDPNNPVLLADDLAYTEASVNDRQASQQILGLDFDQDGEPDQLFALDLGGSEFAAVYIGNRDDDQGNNPFLLVHREDGSAEIIDPG